ncbi:hypothetical protein [Rhodoflexus sp.]
MKLDQIIILSVAVALFLIGVHQSFLHGAMASYWIFMLVAALLFYFKLRSNREAQQEKEETKATANPSGKSKKKPVKPRQRS